MSIRSVGPEAAPLAQRIRDSVNTGTIFLPALPRAAASVLRLLREDFRGPVGSLVDLIGSDVALSASLLRVANSALFGGLGAGSDLRVAIALLGVREVTSIVTMVSHRSLFQSSDPGRQRELLALWDHAVVTSQCARRLARIQRLDATDAFLAGLLHDAGKLLVLRAFDRLSAEPPGRVILAEEREELMRTLHPELGARVLKDWRLPEVIFRTALHHHDAEPPADDRLMLCVRAANAVARKLGAHPKPEPDLDLVALPEMRLLGVGELELATLLEQLEAELADLRRLL